ncbi:MAG: LytR C-terminal domain-containing protein [Thermoleophilia bacterium]|nr:LytR C-terminal domain-containing protein [Thermoleophilia bacterium]
MKKRDFTARHNPGRQASPGSGPDSRGDIRQERRAAAESGYRRSRLASARKSRRRRLARFIIIAGIMAAAGAFAAVSVAIRSERPGAGESAADPGLSRSGSGNVIVVSRDEAGNLLYVGVIIPGGGAGAAEEAGQGSSHGDAAGRILYIIPGRTVASVPDLGFQRLDRLYREAGQAALDQTVADLLQIPIQYHVILTRAAVEMAAGEAGAVNFVTAEPLVMNQAPAGSAAPAEIAAGENPTGLSMAMSLLDAAAADNRDGPKVMAAFFQGLRDALAGKPAQDRQSLARRLLEVIETDMQKQDFVDLVAAVTAPENPLQIQTLPVRTAGGGEEWYFEPLIAEIDLMMQAAPVDDAVQLEIQNGTEAQGVVEAAAARLQPLRFSITTKPEPSEVNFDYTQIRCGSEALSEGNRIRDVLGTGTVIKDEYLEKKQIIVIIGRDLS